MTILNALKEQITDSVLKKLVVTIVVTSLIIFTAMTAVTVSQTTNEVTASSTAKLEAQSDSLAHDLNGEMTNYDRMAASLATTMESYKKGDASRKQVNDILRRTAESNPELLGVYVTYRPNAFDGQDSKYIDDSETGSTSDGQFAPYWNRYDSELNMYALQIDENDQWYHRPLETGEKWIKGPYEYRNQTLVSFIYPIKRNGETVGIAAVDVSVDYWQQYANEVQVQDTGYAFIVGGNGKFVAHPEESWTGSETLSSVSDSHSSSEFQSMSEKIRDGEGGGFTMTDPVTGQEAFVEYRPLASGEFAVATVAPKSEVLAGVHNLRNLLLLISSLSLAGLIIVTFVISKRLTEPIETVRKQAETIADGQFDQEVQSISRNDEIGEMVSNFEEMQTTLQSVFDTIDAFSGDLARGSEELQTRDIETEFSGVYGDVMTSLDRGSAELIDAFEEIQAASEDLQRGQIDQQIDTEYPGKYGDILEAFDDGMNTLSESFTQISSASEGLKNGQLDRRFDTDYPGEYGRTLNDFNEGIQQLSASVQSVQEIADKIARSSEEVTNSTEEIRSASEEVAESVEEISAGAEDQSEGLQEVASEMNDMSATVEEIASSAEEVATTATTAAEQGATGQEYADEASAEIQSIKATSEDATDQVRQLDDHMDEIGEIVGMITEIAEQTNMLALNASIEAARAGEVGEGFGVVADEIKGLAGEATDATAEIEARIEEVQSTTDETVEKMSTLRERVESGSKTIEDAIHMFDEIADAVDEAEGGIQEISRATDDQAASSEEVVSMIDEVSEVSQQNAAEASNVSAATEEQTASLSDITENVQHVSQLAERLNERMSAFDIQEESPAVSVSDTTQMGTMAADNYSESVDE